MTEYFATYLHKTRPEFKKYAFMDQPNRSKAECSFFEVVWNNPHYTDYLPYCLEEKLNKKNEYPGVSYEEIKEKL